MSLTVGGGREGEGDGGDRERGRKWRGVRERESE